MISATNLLHIKPRFKAVPVLRTNDARPWGYHVTPSMGLIIGRLGAEKASLVSDP